jgi:D-3-phosphoglycerate dehydrogenase
MQRVRILLADELLAGVPAKTREWYPADEVEFVLAGKADEGEFLKLVGDADILMNMRRRIDRRVLEAGRWLSLVQQCGVGVDHIDLAAADALGIRVANAAGSGVIPVAEHAIMLMLAVSRQLVRCDQTMRRDEWIQMELFGRIVELYGKTLGIVGFGRIGQRLAKIALHGFDMRVQYYDKFEVDTSAIGSGIRRVSLEELLRTSDYVSVHCNLSDETRALIGRRELGMMKPAAILINTARGAVVDEEALCEALRDGVIKGAGLDVFGSFNDSLEPGSPLTRLPNVVLTPHVATMTPENLDRTFYDIALRNVMSFVGGKELRNQMNAPAMPRPLISWSLAHHAVGGEATANTWHAA